MAQSFTLRTTSLTSGRILVSWWRLLYQIAKRFRIAWRQCENTAIEQQLARRQGTMGNEVLKPITLGPFFRFVFLVLPISIFPFVCLEIRGLMDSCWGNFKFAHWANTKWNRQVTELTSRILFTCGRGRNVCRMIIAPVITGCQDRLYLCAIDGILVFDF